MKGLLGVLLVVALMVPVLGAGCGPEPAAGENGGGIEVQLPTPSPEASPVGGEEGSVQLQPGQTYTFQYATPPPLPVTPPPLPVTPPPLPRPGEGDIILFPPGRQTGFVLGVVEPPETGDTVVITLNCEARAEELIILGQYLELQGYIRDLNAQTEEMFKPLSAIFGWVLWCFSSWDLVAEQGVVVGILQVEPDTVLGVPFVTNMGIPLSEDPGEILEELLRAVAARDVDALYRTSMILAEQWREIFGR